MSFLPLTLTVSSARAAANAIADGFDRVVRSLIVEIQRGNEKVDPNEVSKINQKALDYAEERQRILVLLADGGLADLRVVNPILETWSEALGEAQVYAHSVGVDVVVTKVPDDEIGIGGLAIGGLLLIALVMSASGSRKK